MLKEFQDRQTWLKKRVKTLDALSDCDGLRSVETLNSRLKELINDPYETEKTAEDDRDVLDCFWGFTEQLTVYDDPIFHEDCSRVELKQKAKTKLKELQEQYKQTIKCYLGSAGGGYKRDRLKDRIWEYDHVIIPTLSLKSKEVGVC